MAVAKPHLCIRSKLARGNMEKQHSGSILLIADPLKELSMQILSLSMGWNPYRATFDGHLLRKTRRAGALAVVASHHAWVAWPRPLALLARLSPTPMLMAQLFFQLTEKRPTPVQLAEALQAFDCHSGDLRSIWLDLYQLHEQRTRPGRTKKLSVSYSSL